MGFSPLIINSVCNQANPERLSDSFHCVPTHSFQLSLYPLSFPLCVLAALHRVLHRRKTQYKSDAYQNGTFWHFRTTSSAWGGSKRHASNVPKVAIRDSTAFTMTSINKSVYFMVTMSQCKHPAVFPIFHSLLLPRPCVCHDWTALKDRRLQEWRGCSYP